MFRAAMANQAEMGVLQKSYIDKVVGSNEITNRVLGCLSQDDIKETGFLLDSYPRTIEQLMPGQNVAELGIELKV